MKLTLQNGKAVNVIAKKNACVLWVAVPGGAVATRGRSEFRIEDDAVLHRLPTLRRSQAQRAAQP